MAQRSQVCENGPELILVHSEVGRAVLVLINAQALQSLI